MSWPIDTNVTTFVASPFSPSTPGAADLNRWSQGIVNLANPPTTTLSSSSIAEYNSSETFNRVYWNQIVSQTDSTMLRTNSTGSPGTSGWRTDRIYLPYPGEVEVLAVLRTQANTTAGYGQLAVSVSFDSTYPDSQQDTDTRLQMSNIQWAVTLRCTRRLTIGQTQVNAGVALVVDYAQDSGGVTTVRTSYPAYPLFQVSYVGKGGQS